jgi:hypothetical protein
VKFLRVKSEEPRTPFAPSWDYSFSVLDFSKMRIEELAALILSKEEEIKSLPPSTDDNGNPTDGYTGLGLNSTTSRFQNYNVLKWDHECVRELRLSIKEAFRSYNETLEYETPDVVFIQCWANILRKGQKIRPHFHAVGPHCYLSGHFNVQTTGETSTVYLSPINQLNDPHQVGVPNVNGEMTIFPSYIFHYTTPHSADEPRITIAFDLSLEKFTDNWLPL